MAESGVGGATQLLSVGRWQLQPLVEPGSQQGYAQPSAYLELDLSQARFSGHAGCNRFMGVFEADPPRLRFGSPAMTRMHCGEGVMRREQEFIQALQQVRSFQASGREMELRDESGRVLARFRAVPAQP